MSLLISGSMRDAAALTATASQTALSAVRSSGKVKGRPGRAMKAQTHRGIPTLAEAERLVELHAVRGRVELDVLCGSVPLEPHEEGSDAVASVPTTLTPRV